MDRSSLPTEHVATTPVAAPTTSTVHVQTTAGPVRGRWRDIVSHPDRRGPEPRYARSAAFYGIPYAEQPTGEHRLTAPVRRRPWSRVRDALVPAPTPQRVSVYEDPAVPEPSVPGEDVLTVNVFTPAPGEETALLPVLVWIHGGGFTSGSHNSPWYDGAAFNRDGVVTVSVAYRVGLDGFGWVEGSDAPCNRGVLDQVMALEWVRDNITRFGGDPSRVTIGGQSAGGGSCVVLLSVPRARGLFRAVISQSGAVPDVPIERLREDSARLAGMLDVEPTLDGWRSTDHDEVCALQNALAAGGDGGADPVAAVASVLAGARRPSQGLRLAPAVDGDVVVAPITQAMAEGHGQDVALLAGATTHDFTFLGHAYAESAAGWDGEELLVAGGLPRELARRLVAARPEHAHEPHLLLGDLLSDATFHLPVAAWLTARAERARAAGEGAGGWAYELSHCCGREHLASHCTDIPFAFDCLMEPYCDHTLGTLPPQALADEVHATWVRFIETARCPWPQWAGGMVGRRFGDNRSGELVLAEDRVLYDTAADLLDLAG